MSEDENDGGIYKVDTVPPPDGEDDAYSAPTKVGVMAESLVKEIMHAAERKSAELREGEARKRAASGAAASELAAPSDATPIDAPPAPAPAPPAPAVIRESAPRARASKPDHLPPSASNQHALTDADLVVDSQPPPRMYEDVEEGEPETLLGKAARPREVTAPLPPELVNAARVAAAAKEAAASQVATEASRLAPAPHPAPAAAQPFNYVPLVIGLTLFVLGLALYLFR
jgi:hypothetical protein